MIDDEKACSHQRWAHLRFSIVGPLLASPPGRGELQAELRKLAAKSWVHPVTAEPARFSMSTIQRWYYAARADERDPVGILRRKIREDSGQQRSITVELAQLIEAQYGAHKRWSYQLHVDNLRVEVAAHPDYGRMPSYATIVRYMKSHAHLPPRRSHSRRYVIELGHCLDLRCVGQSGESDADGACRFRCWYAEHRLYE